MATFGAIASPAPNVLFDPAKVDAQVMQQQRNQLLMETSKQDQAAQMYERDTTARIGLARRWAGASPEELSAGWGPDVQRLQQAGLGHGIDPTTPPPRERLQQIAASDLTTFQRLKLDVEKEQAQALGLYRDGMLGVAQGRLALSAARPPGSGRARDDGDGITLVPIGASAPAAPAAPSAGSGTTAGPAPVPAGPQVSQAAPAPEISGPAQRMGGVDVAGPGAPPAAPAAPAGPPPGTRLMLKNGVPITAGLATGKAWGVDATGQRIVVDIPGAGKPAGEAPPPVGGNGLEPALINILGTGDPSSWQYAAAFAKLSEERDLGNGRSIRPDMSWARAPTYRPPGVMEPRPGGAGAAAPGVEPVIPEGGRAYGKAERTEAPVGPTPEMRNQVRQAELGATRITSALDRFNAVFKEQGGGGVNAYLNNPQSPEAQKLVTAFDIMKTTLRDPAFLNTGVLQPAEAQMLENMLLSPQSLRGMMASPAAMEAKLNEIRGFITAGIARQRASIERPAQSAGPGGVGTAEPPPSSGSRPPLSSFGR